LITFGVTFGGLFESDKIIAFALSNIIFLPQYKQFLELLPQAEVEVEVVATA
jgi:hypothetical protein